MTAFDEATAVSARGDGRYEAIIDPRFALVAPGGKTPPAINGGVLMATVLRAVLAEAPQPYPVATSANFLSVANLAPAEIEVSWLKQGRTASVARGVLRQDGQPVLDTTITTGTLPAPPVGGAASAADDDAVEWTGDRAPFPAMDDCVDLGQWRGTIAEDGTAGYAAQVDVRFDPATTGWRRHEPSGVPEMRGYVGMRESAGSRCPAAGVGRRRAAAGRVRPRRDWLGAHGRADLVHAGCPGTWPAAGGGTLPARQRWLVRRRVRGLGCLRAPGGPEQATGQGRPGPSPGARRRCGQGTLLIFQTKIDASAATMAVPANSVG